MKLKNRVLSTVLVASLLTTMSVTPVLAGEYSSTSTTASAEGHSSFKKAWKDSATVKVDGLYYDFIYGYDTWWTNEDYIDDVEAQEDNDTTYYGKIKNEDGTTNVTNKKSGTSQTGKADVKHEGKKVTYYVYARE